MIYSFLGVKGFEIKNLYLKNCREFFSIRHQKKKSCFKICGDCARWWDSIDQKDDGGVGIFRVTFSNSIIEARRPIPLSALAHQ
jgi:hypothetical protein